MFLCSMPDQACQTRLAWSINTICAVSAIFPIFTIALAHSRTCARLTIALARLRTGKAISKLPDDSMSMIDVRDCAAQHVAALEGEKHHGTAFPPL